MVGVKNPIQLPLPLSLTPSLTPSLFLGYPRVNTDKKIRELREYGANHPECWTNQHDDESLILHIKNYAELSREHQLKCHKMEIPYFDTSDNFNDVWNQAYDYLMQKLSE